ncbi:MAG TPA: aminoglycoside phosphotransferase family protein [Armatimonadota bacterium]|jgi:aminoglycoside phosphotransferase (APT) family kinase protein
MDYDEQAEAEAIVGEGLRRLGWPEGGVAGVETLHGGISGARAYRIRFDDGRELVLKARLPDADADSHAGAAREAEFYRRLAARLPVRTPRIHGVEHGPAVGVWMVMESLRPAPSPAACSAAHFARVAEDLGRLHAAFWGRAAELDACEFLIRRPIAVSDDELAHARASWAHVREEPRFAPVWTEARVRFIEAAIATTPEAQRHLAALPETLIQGDCHIGNILLDAAGALVWADWQGAAIGRGPADLSFLYQRADVAGATVDLEALLAAYHRGLSGALGEDIPIDALRRAALASEWTVRLLEWPHYLDYATPESLAAFMDRLDALAAALSIDLPPVAPDGVRGLRPHVSR